MKRTLLRSLCLTCIVFCVSSPLLGATVKKKTGETVEGEIQGMIVQRGPIEESEEDGKKTYSATYYLWNGADVDRIDENGVRLRVRQVAFVIVTENQPINDLEALESAVRMPEQAMFGSTSSGGSLVRMGGTTREIPLHAEALLGSFNYDPATGKGRLRPSLEVTTSSGTVELSVAELVKFNQKPKPGADDRQE